MKPLPFPVRLAAGLAVTTVERAREMPRQLAGLPITMVSQALQTSMRVQQNITELAIKGDDVLAGLRPVEEAPSWATFDEDLPATEGAETATPTEVGEQADPDTGLGTVTALDSMAGNGRPRSQATSAPDDDPWAEEERALARDYADGTFDSPSAAPHEDLTAPPGPPAPAGVHNYDDLTLPQLRARLRQFSVPQLEELLAYEREHANRSSFTGMLTRRIDNVRGAGGEQSGRDA